MPKRKTKSQSTTIPHPLAQAIREEAAKEAPAEPQGQPIPAPVWSVLRGLRNRGYSVQQISVFLSRHGYSIDPIALAKRLKPRNAQTGQSQAERGDDAAQENAASKSSDASAAEPTTGADDLEVPPAGRNGA